MEDLSNITLSNIEIDLLLKDMKLDRQSDQNKTVLVIDDDKWIHRVVVHYLKNWGFHPVSAFDPIEGVALSIELRPRLILLDIVMPDIKGDVMLKLFKRIESTANIPIIIISGNLSIEVLGTTYKDGAAGFITKPIKEVVLLKKINEVLMPSGMFDIKG